MTTWIRDRMLRHCGQCGRDIPVSEVFLRLTFGGQTFKKYRCADCAGPAPDLPADPEPNEPAPPIDLTRLGLLPLDWSRRPQPVGREREPSEEG